MTRAAVDVVEIEFTAACNSNLCHFVCSDLKAFALTVVYCPPDLATTIAPEGGEVLATPWTKAARPTTTSNRFWNIITKSKRLARQ